MATEKETCGIQTVVFCFYLIYGDLSDDGKICWNDYLEHVSYTSSTIKYLILALNNNAIIPCIALSLSHKRIHWGPPPQKVCETPIVKLCKTKVCGTLY